MRPELRGTGPTLGAPGGGAQWLERRARPLPLTPSEPSSCSQHGGRRFRSPQLYTETEGCPPQSRKHTQTCHPRPTAQKQLPARWGAAVEGAQDSPELAGCGARTALARVMTASYHESPFTCKSIIAGTPGKLSRENWITSVLLLESYVLQIANQESPPGPSTSRAPGCSVRRVSSASTSG